MLTNRKVEDAIKAYDEHVTQWMEDETRRMAHTGRSMDRYAVDGFYKELWNQFNEYVKEPYGNEIVELLMDDARGKEQIENALVKEYYRTFHLWIEYYQEVAKDGESAEKRFADIMANRYCELSEQRKLMKWGLKELIKRMEKEGRK